MMLQVKSVWLEGRKEDWFCTTHILYQGWRQLESATALAAANACLNPEAWNWSTQATYLQCREPYHSDEGYSHCDSARQKNSAGLGSL